MAVEGAEESAAALGGGIEELGAGVEELGAGVEEAAEGVIIDTMPGAYSFAFLKNPSSSDRGQAREELIFSQIHLFAIRLSKCNCPFDTPFYRPPLHGKHRIFTGVEGFGKLLEVVNRHLLFLLWP
jgi:hypothetical protein